MFRRTYTARTVQLSNPNNNALYQPPGFSPRSIGFVNTFRQPNPPRAEARQLIKNLRSIFFIVPFLSLGCVQREMSIVSNPTGAVVYLNDREIGRTPFQRQFQWYGTYDVVVRKDGYQTLKTAANVFPPLWQLVPLDAVTDFLPLKDEHALSFTLKPDEPVDPVALLERGQKMQDDLQSTVHTVNRAVTDVHPTTKPSATQPDVQAPD